MTNRGKNYFYALLHQGLGLLRRAYEKSFFLFLTDSKESDFDRDLRMMQSRRDRVVLWLCGGFFALIVAFLALVGWQREFSSAYLVTKAAITHFENGNVKWLLSSARSGECGNQNDCYKILNARPRAAFEFAELTRPLMTHDKLNANDETTYILLETTIDRAAWREVYDSGGKRFVVGWPTSNYLEANAYINGQLVGTYLRSSRIGVPVSLTNVAPDNLVLQVMYTKDKSHIAIFEDDGEPLLIASPGEYNSWLRMLIMKSASRGAWVSDLAFIVMAAFFLMMYLFVDSSPEVLGLALFVSLDALSRSFGYGWLPYKHIGEVGDTLDSASQILRLYFLLQLARVGSAKIRPWLWAASIYAIFASAGSWVNAFGGTFIPDQTAKINVVCSILVSIIGMTLSIVSTFSIRNKGVPWRRWALIIGAFACLLQCLAYINHIFTAFENYPMFFQVRAIILPLSVYALASSAFVNISTLENRVRVLSDAKSRNELIEKELELGRAVQNAYMRIPELPSEVDMSCYFEAAFYVSGDTYFVHWEPDTKRVAFILGDMTGHGVHAALKSSTLQVIARTIFRDPIRRKGLLGERFVVYEQTLNSFFRESWGDGDLPTFLGIEIDLKTGAIASHRVNFPYPLVVYKSEDGTWRANVLTKNDNGVNLKAKNSDSFILSATDGILGGSRQIKKLCEQLGEELDLRPIVSASIIKEVVLQLTSLAKSGEDDDKTMIVFGVKDPDAAA